MNRARTIVLQSLYFLVKIKRDSRLKPFLGVTINIGNGA